MQAQRKENLVQAIILAGFACLLFNLLSTGKIVLFINPRLAWLVGLASVLLGVIALAKLIPATGEDGHEHRVHDSTCACDHADHSLSAGNVRLAVLFLTPLILGFLMQPRVLGTAALFNSISTAGSLPFYAGPPAGFGENVPSLPAGTSDPASRSGSSKNDPTSIPGDARANAPTTAATTINPVRPADPPGTAVSLIENTDLAQLDVTLYDNQEQLSGRRFRLTGFVYKDAHLGKNQFVITRFVITCCLLDTTPIGIIAEGSASSGLKADTWVEVEGTLKMLNTFRSADQIEPVSNFHRPNTDIPCLEITALKQVPAPNDPYLYSPQ
jgi:putative membrane protein